MHEEMLNSVAIHCPYCSSGFDLLVDVSQGSHATWEDCPRCCAPIQVAVAVSEINGDFEGVSIGRDDDAVFEPSS